MSEMVGQVFETNGGVDCVVIKYKSTKEVWVKFLDIHGYEVSTQLTDLKFGKVKNPYAPSIHGVGYVGVGKHKVSVASRKTKTHQVWSSMMERGYCEKYKYKNPTYLECSVHPDWHNFQVFAEWYTNHESYGLGYHLDKDLLIKGNKVYSEDTCCLLPRDINAAILSGGSCRKDLPVGVYLIKRNSKYFSSVRKFNKNTHLGVFSTIDEAAEAYKIAKKAHLIELANIWKETIDSKVYEALLKWEVL